MWKTSFIFALINLAACEQLNSTKKVVCIIGAGASGVTSAKLLANFPEEFEPIVFEKQSSVGGNWIYTDCTTVDERGLPVCNSIYKNLRINYLKQLEAFPEYPEFRGDASMGNYPLHTDMAQYLRNYTKYFDLNKYIKLSTIVEKVSPLPDMKWLVEARDLDTNKTSEIQCDAVIVANGNNFKGHIPKIAGIESFSGRVMHSRFYRYPQEFANQTVLLLGASFSGIDISIDISTSAKKIYLSHRHDRMQIELPPNVEQVLGAVGAEGSELILSDGSRLKADALMFCTGYEYEYSFLDESSGIVVEEDGKYIPSVYKHMINMARPTMAIFNIPTPGDPFLLPHAQAAYFIAVLQGKIILPSLSEMLKDSAVPPGVPKSKYHATDTGIYDYYNEISRAAGSNPFSELYLTAALAFDRLVTTDPLHFREKKFRIEFY